MPAAERAAILGSESQALQVELEHGTRFPDANVTVAALLQTDRIAELEGDLLKATKARDADKVRSLYERIVLARLSLNQAEVGFLAGT